MGIANLGMNIQYAVYALFLLRELAIGPAVIGLLFGIGGVAALLGAASAAPLARVIGRGPTMVWDGGLSPPGYLIAPVVMVSLDLPRLALGRLLCGLGIPVCNIHQTSLWQGMTPDRLEGG